MTDSFGLFTSNGYISPYVTLVGQGTYTDQNPYVLDQSNATIIDHVLHKGGYKAVDAKVRFVFSKQLCCSKSLKRIVRCRISTGRQYNDQTKNDKEYMYHK